MKKFLVSILITIIAFFDRSFHRIFNRLCFKIKFDKNIFKYNDILDAGDNTAKLRYLGKNWVIPVKSE